jgi:hypothetical protein
MSIDDSIRVLWWPYHHGHFVANLVGNFLAILDTNILLDFFLGDSHGVGSVISSIIEDVALELLAESNLGGLGYC